MTHCSLRSAHGRRRQCGRLGLLLDRDWRNDRRLRPSSRTGLDGSVKLTRLLGTVVFLLVLVPSLSAALDALHMEAISGPATLMLTKLLDAVPNIIAAAVVLTLTWYVARFAAALLERLLQYAGFDAVPQRVGLQHVLHGAALPSRLAHWAVLFFAMLFAVVEAVALSFGLGGREAAGKLMDHWLARWRGQDKDAS